MRIFASLLTFTAASAILCGQTPTVKSVPLTYTQPDDGKEMFNAYCAVCHGVDGTGTGPAAAALKKAPADLTQLTIKNKGTYPDRKVSLVISSGPAEMVSHGSKDMPMWGRLFKASAGEGVARIRVSNLVAYVKTLQR